jgi:exonuclease SbcD
MSGELIRFIHASDFHLEQPLYGLDAVPDHLREWLLEAPYQAATRVFDSALAEHVDFLILSGDILDPLHGSPRALAFLTEQLQRLSERDIAVYWVGSEQDSPENWPSVVPLPDNVHHLSANRVQSITHRRSGEVSIGIIGASTREHGPASLTDYHPDSLDHFTIGIWHGLTDAAVLARQPLNYWALGGEHQRKTLFSTPHAAHYPGSPQGRSPEEAGPHGCTLVSVDPDGKVRMQMLATDVIRWHEERLNVTESQTKLDLQRLLRERTQALAAEAGDRALLLRWQLQGTGRMSLALRQGDMAAELLRELQTEFGHRRFPIWTTGIDSEPPVTLPVEWYEEDSILGDFLRSVRDHESGKHQPVDVSDYLRDEPENGVIRRLLVIPDLATRTRLMREAAVLGVDLLRGEAALET